MGNVANFLSEERLVDAAAARLRQAGFEVLQASGAMININGSPETYGAAFGAPLVVREETVIKEHAREDVAQFLDCPNTDLPGLIGTRGTARALDLHPQPGQPVLLLGGCVPHEVRPATAGHLRWISVLCFEMVPGTNARSE